MNDRFYKLKYAHCIPKLIHFYEDHIYIKNQFK